MILVVDDDDDLRASICEALEAEGYQSVGARNGEEALTTLRRRPKIDLVLLDLMMPVMSGHEFRKAQLADPDLARLPVVPMTATWDREEAAGFDDFLMKPVKLQVLLGCVRKHLPGGRR